MWQRIWWPGSTSTSGGSVSSQIAPSLRGQRVWKTQPDGGVGRARDVALQPDPIAPAAVDRRHRREQRLRVRVVRAVEDDVGRAELLQAAEVEDGDAVGDVAHDAEVVRDEEVRDPLLGLQLDEQVEDRGLHRHVERGGRLVADDELRVARERAGDRDALLEPAGELHGLLRQRPLGEPHPLGERRACVPRQRAR